MTKLLTITGVLAFLSLHAMGWQHSAPGDMVLIPAGENSGTDPDSGEYRLKVVAFYLDKHPVTLGKWQEIHKWAVGNNFIFSNAGKGQGPNHPVHTVSWLDAVAWCNARSIKENREPVYYTDFAFTQVFRISRVLSVELFINSSANGYRLPTDTEWEYAARGGQSSRRYPWGDSINHDLANYRASRSSYNYDSSSYDEPTFHPKFANSSHPYTSPVGSFDPNGFGLFDMAGNVQEWTYDRTTRGGSWANDSYGCRITLQDRNLPIGNSSTTVGFRTVLSGKQN